MTTPTTQYVSTNKNDEMSPSNPTNPTYQQNNGMSKKDKDTVMLRSTLRKELKKDIRDHKTFKDIQTGLSVFGIGCFAAACYFIGGIDTADNKDKQLYNGMGLGAISLAAVGAALAMDTQEGKRKNKLVRKTISNSEYASPEAKRVAYEETVKAVNSPASNIVNGVEFIAGAAGAVNAINAAVSVAMTGLADTFATVDFKTLGVAGAIISAAELFKQAKDVESARRVETALGNAMPLNIEGKKLRPKDIMAMKNAAHSNC